MTSSVMSIRRLVRKGSRATSALLWKNGPSRNCPSPADNDDDTERQKNEFTGRLKGKGQQVVSHCQSNFPGDHIKSTRKTVAMERQDNETFGFDIKTHCVQDTDSAVRSLYSFVSSVKEQSPAERAGLKAGDIIISINDICTEGYSHQQIIELVQNSASLLKMDTMSGDTVKQLELKHKLRLLQWQLRQKREALSALRSQEERLTRGNRSGTESDNSSESLTSLLSTVGGARECPRTPRTPSMISSSSNRSSGSLGTMNSEDSDSLSCAFEELNLFSPFSASSEDSGTFFSSSESFAVSSFDSPSRSRAAFGTKRVSIRRNLMRLLPWIQWFLVQWFIQWFLDEWRSGGEKSQALEDQVPRTCYRGTSRDHDEVE
ncbi:cytohesin-interacting protein-like [Chanos chanos]|uniref:Cytohesin-interacting protein-like n=1 Tax=Chanos chanos TaxID=29144 RepID=A0A6J2VX93_CHACN|nr:cytohesin-interacting protein-like [Chanos chanos]